MENNKQFYNSYGYKAARKNGDEVPYLGFGIGWTPKKKDPVVHPAADGKKEWVTSTVNITEPAAGVFAKANDTFDANKTYEENPFVGITAFNGIGKKVSEVPGGSRIAVAGVLEEGSYTSKKDGKEVKTYKVLADAVQYIGEKASLSRYCAFSTRVYEHNGVKKTQPIVNLLMAKVTSIGELRFDKNQRPYLMVQAETGIDHMEILDRAEGVNTEGKTYSNKGKVTLFFSGKMAEIRVDTTKKTCLKVGQLVCVVGSVDRNEYEGTTYCNVRVTRCVLAKEAEASANADDAKDANGNKPEAPAPAAPAPAPAAEDGPPAENFDAYFDEEDDDLPF